MSQGLLSGRMVRNARVAMTRGVLAGGLSGLLFCAGLAVAQDQAPPLTPPALEPPATAPTPATPRPRSASGSSSSSASSPTTKPAQAAPAEPRPLLVIPGVTAPVPSRPGTRPNRPRPVAGSGAADLTAPTVPSTARASLLPPIEELPPAGRDPALTSRSFRGSRFAPLKFAATARRARRPSRFPAGLAAQLVDHVRPASGPNGLER